MADRRKQLVADGYDEIAERYASWGRDAVGDSKRRYLDLFQELVAPGGRVLDLGCGTGEQVTRHLAPRYRVVGVDISVRSVEIAARNVADASFVVGDIGSVAWRADSFDGVLASFSLIHVPRDEHAALFRRVATWLRPGGWLVATLGVGAAGEAEAEFLGVPMFWSSFDAAVSVDLVRRAGLEVVSAIEESDDEDGVPVAHLWVVARKNS